MAKNNELALAFNFKDAPAELRKIAEVHNENFKRLQKSKDQLALWQAEMITAESEYIQSGKIFRAGLDNWEPQPSSEKLQVIK